MEFFDGFLKTWQMKWQVLFRLLFTGQSIYQASHRRVGSADAAGQAKRLACLDLTRPHSRRFVNLWARPGHTRQIWKLLNPNWPDPRDWKPPLARPDPTWQKTYICTPGCASFEMRTPHHQHPLSAESTSKVYRPQHSSTSHPMAFGLGYRVWVKARVRVGWSALGHHGQILWICTWYYIHGTRNLGVVVVHFIVCAFQTRAPTCA